MIIFLKIKDFLLKDKILESKVPVIIYSLFLNNKKEKEARFINTIGIIIK